MKIMSRFPYTIAYDAIRDIPERDEIDGISAKLSRSECARIISFISSAINFSAEELATKVATYAQNQEGLPVPPACTKSRAEGEVMSEESKPDLFEVAWLSSYAYSAFGDQEDAKETFLLGWNARASVPPFGGKVEVLSYRIDSDHGHHFLDTPSRGTSLTCTKLVDRDHVTRLQETHQGELAGAQAMLETAYAERDALKSENESFRKNYVTELTKARELLKEAETWMDTQEYVQPGRIWAELHAGINDFIANQSAPAAKDGE